MKFIKLLVLLVLIVHTGFAQNQVRLIPQPESIRHTGNTFQLNSAKRLAYSKDCKKEALYFSQFLSKATGVKLKKGKLGSQGTISFSLNKVKDQSLGEEGYNLKVEEDQIILKANTAEGIFYGVQSLRQMLPVSFEKGDGTSKINITIPTCTVKDQPRFSWRALMLDESRYFHGMEEVKLLLDQMALLKMNVFHWHLTDDAGWRIEIKKYPKLTEVGSTRKDSEIGTWKSGKSSGEPHSGFYTQKQIKEIVAYAAERHITIVPEIEMPGHASAAIASYPWLGILQELTEVPVVFGKLDDSYNVIDPKVIQFLHDVLEETFELFPSKVVHIGGDEVRFDCWKESKEIQEYMAANNLKNPKDLQIEFTNRISQFIDSKGRRMMGWNEIMGANVHEWQSNEDAEATVALSKNSVVHFWKGDVKLIGDAAQKGYDIVNSHHIYTYLDYSYKSIPLKKAYEFNPIPEGLSKEDAKHIIGSGCQMWTEWVPTAEVLHKRVYPRLAAYAEVGWTAVNEKSYEEFLPALENNIFPRWEIQNIGYSKEY